MTILMNHLKNKLWIRYLNELRDRNHKSRCVFELIVDSLKFVRRSCKFPDGLDPSRRSLEDASNYREII